MSRRQGRKRNNPVTLSAIQFQDATKERIKNAERLGLHAKTRMVSQANGLKSTEKYRHIESALEHAIRHGWITDIQKRAAEILSTHLIGSGIQQRVTMSWSSTVDGQRGECVTDARDRHARLFRHAMLSIPQRYRDGFFDWFVKIQSEDATAVDLGIRFRKSENLQGCRDLGREILEVCLDCLVDHMGLQVNKRLTAK